MRGSASGTRTCGIRVRAANPSAEPSTGLRTFGVMGRTRKGVGGELAAGRGRNTAARGPAAATRAPLPARQWSALPPRPLERHPRSRTATSFCSLGSPFANAAETLEGLLTRLPAGQRREALSGIALESGDALWVPAVRAKTLAHELAHHPLHRDAVGTEADRPTFEAEAEGTAYAVLSYFGFDASEYSFAYVARWTESKEVVKTAISNIQKTVLVTVEAVESRDAREDRATGPRGGVVDHSRARHGSLAHIVYKRRCVRKSRRWLRGPRIGRGGARFGRGRVRGRAR